MQQISNDTKSPDYRDLKHADAVLKQVHAKTVPDDATARIEKHLKEKFKVYAQTADKLKLSSNAEFKAFLLDLYVNSPVTTSSKKQADEHRDTVLLDRFVRLLICLDNKDATHVDKASLINSLFPLNPSGKQLENAASLSEDRQFNLRL